MGRIIKTIGKAIAIICPIICIASGYIIIDDAKYNAFGALLTVVGYATLIGGSIISIIAGVLVIGFGELIENSADIRDAAYKFINSTGANRTDYNSPDFTKPIAKHSAPLPPSPTKVQSETWRCSECGDINPARNLQCSGCGNYK